MLGFRDTEKVHKALVLGPEAEGAIAGERAQACDPFYRAWLRATRRALARNVLTPEAARPIELDAPRGWVASGEWGDTASADLDMLAFDHRLLDSLDTEAAKALLDGRPYPEAATALQLRDDCARIHEAFEELLMQLHRDPDAAAHAECHRSLQAQREQLRACHARGELGAARSVQAALQHWCDEHIAGPDAALERFLGALRTSRPQGRPAPLSVAR